MDDSSNSGDSNGQDGEGGDDDPRPSAKVINLNKFRKRVHAEQAKRDAEHNRVRHGRSKSERRLADGERERGGRLLDDKRLNGDASEVAVEKPDADPEVKDP